MYKYSKTGRGQMYKYKGWGCILEGVYIFYRCPINFPSLDEHCERAGWHSGWIMHDGNQVENACLAEQYTYVPHYYNCRFRCATLL